MKETRAVRREPVTAGDVDAALDYTTGVLAAGLDRDWAAAAGPIRWTCRKTAVHLAECLVAYAAQLAVEAADDWVSFRLTSPRGAVPGDLVELVRASGRIASTSLSGTPPSVRAWHPYGSSDPEGFAAMAVTELLVHGADIASGLSLAFDPPRPLCRRALDRLFPEAPAQGDPWSLLCWATGRLALDGHPRRRRWRWHGPPLD